MKRKWTIKTVSWIPVLLVLSAGCAGVAQPGVDQITPSPKAECASGDWTVIRRMHFGQSTVGVMFGDESFGVAVDLGGGIHYTEDGGTIWTQAFKAGFSRVALEISEGNRRIWHIAFGGEVLLSTDRARVWQRVSAFPHNQHVEYVSFSNENAGWGMTTELRTFFITADGGKTWSARPFPEGMAAPAALHLRTPSEGYLLDVAGSLFVSADGGDTWVANSLDLPEGMTIPTLNHSAVVRFSDAMHGVIALNRIGGGEGFVSAQRTADGGATWTEEPLPVKMGMFHLTRDGVFLTHVDLNDQGKITLLCSAKSLRIG